MKYIIVIMGFCLFACSGNQDTSNTENSQSETISSGESCLAEMTDPASWLTLSEAAKITNRSENDIRQKVHPQTNNCQYLWKSGRMFTLTLNKNEMEVEATDKIGITTKNLDEAIEKWLSKKYIKQKEMSYVEYFDKFHGNPITEKERKQLDKGLDKKAEKDNDFSKDDAKLTKGLLSMSKFENYTKLTDLGDQAHYYIQTSPNHREVQLAVLHGNVALLVAVDVSDDDNEDIAVAKAVAEAVLDKCD